MSFFRTGFRELALKLKRQRTRIALRHDQRLLQKSEINLGREGTAQAANFPELRNEIVALKKLEQEQKEVALRIARIEEGIKRIEEERQQIAREQANAIAKLEAEKKPLLQKRNQAKSNAEVCERELAGVERRIQESEAADRDLLKQLSDLHALDPAPPDLEALSAGIMAKRARLPDERAELVRARLGSADAVRMAKEKLNTADAELAAVEKNMARMRSEFEARDRKLAESIKTQQQAARDARTRHQTVEERKNPAYLSIGRHLSEKGVAPPNAPHLLEEAHRRRAAVDLQLKHKAELAHSPVRSISRSCGSFISALFRFWFCWRSRCSLFSNLREAANGCRRKPTPSCRSTRINLNGQTSQSAGAMRSPNFGRD